MSRPGSCTSKLCWSARTSLTSNYTRRLSGHSPQKWSLVCSVLSNLPEANRYGALKSAITGAFGRSRDACFVALD
ncbi:hypothetical protein E2C01_078821 [Portunus trituberculatus]|uniref:Uncharacterized protein n=1 Tax=Portunus trituberculatus TaxID=210409 RepID=A0A5B7IR55_PORTR|nr:hypothetical protein [Portunus trituberculatus]